MSEELLRQWVRKCVEAGSFTNHGKFVRDAEKKVAAAIENSHFVSIFGSKVVGTAIAIWLCRNSVSSIDGLSDKSILSFREFLGTNRIAADADCPRKNYKTLSVIENLNVGDLENIKADTANDIIVIQSLIISKKYYSLHQDLDYAIVLSRSLEDHKALVSMRSSYGADEHITEVTATMNGRPSELIGLAIQHSLQSSQN